MSTVAFSCAAAVVAAARRAMVKKVCFMGMMIGYIMMGWAEGNEVRVGRRLGTFFKNTNLTLSRPGVAPPTKGR